MSVPSPAAADRGASPAPALQVVALAMLLGLQPVTTDLYLPALPGLRADLQAGMGATQLTLSALMLAFGLSQLVLGPLGDRFGRRPVLLGGLSLYVVAAIGAALASTIEGLVACRALQGLGLAASVVVARAMLRDWFEPQEGARMMAKALSGLGVIALASPLIGGVLAAGLGWRWAILATAVFGAATLALIALRVPESLPRPDLAALRPSGLVANWRTVLSNPTFRAYALLTALAYATLYAFLAGSSFVFIEVLGLRHHAYGALVAGGAALYVTGTLICRRWLRTLSIADTVARGACFTALGALGMGLAAFVLPPSPWALMIPHVGIMTRPRRAPALRSGRRGRAVPAPGRRGGGAVGLRDRARRLRRRRVAQRQPRRHRDAARRHDDGAGPVHRHLRLDAGPSARPALAPTRMSDLRRPDTVIDAEIDAVIDANRPARHDLTRSASPARRPAARPPPRSRWPRAPAGRDHQRRLRAGLSRDGHRHRQAHARTNWRQRAAPPDRHHRSGRRATPPRSSSRDAQRLMRGDPARAAGRPLIVGGTMLYLQGAVRRACTELPQADAALRARTRRAWPPRAAGPRCTPMLAEVDPVTAARLAPNDAQRIQRALEVCRLSGRADVRRCWPAAPTPAPSPARSTAPTA